VIAACGTPRPEGQQFFAQTTRDQKLAHVEGLGPVIATAPVVAVGNTTIHAVHVTARGATHRHRHPGRLRPDTEPGLSRDREGVEADIMDQAA
jgi:hypothetical protein